MDDARVPRALRLLIDHDEFITAWAETVFGRGAHGSIFPLALADWDLTQDEYKQQLEWKQPKDDAIKEALSMLSAAGFDKQTPLRFSLIAATGAGRVSQSPHNSCRRSGSVSVRARSTSTSSSSTRPPMTIPAPTAALPTGCSGNSAGPGRGRHLADHDLPDRRQQQLHGFQRSTARCHDRQAAHHL